MTLYDQYRGRLGASILGILALAGSRAVDGAELGPPASDTNIVEAASPTSVAGPVASTPHQDFCRRMAVQVGSGLDEATTDHLCAQAELRPDCRSVAGQPLFHFDDGADQERQRRILVLGLVHGDEHPTAAIVYRWAERLRNIKSRNSWRLVPMVNPDGFAKNTRTNSNGVDINRNFPSHDWEAHALSWWKDRQRSDPRRYPGPTKASEPETRCVIDHIVAYRPDLIVAMHTPYGVLDYDGPSLPFPKVGMLPWVRLGTYPGSLGRYQWVDHERPVLTVELKGNGGHDAGYYDLQDVAGTLAQML